MEYAFSLHEVCSQFEQSDESLLVAAPVKYLTRSLTNLKKLLILLRDQKHEQISGIFIPKGSYKKRGLIDPMVDRINYYQQGIKPISGDVLCIPLNPILFQTTIVVRQSGAAAEVHCFLLFRARFVLSWTHRCRSPDLHRTKGSPDGKIALR
jgi:hypothetical protein